MTNEIVNSVHEVARYTKQGAQKFLGTQVTVATEFCTVVSDICGSLVRNLLHVTLLAPIIYRWVLEFWRIFTLLQ